MKISIVIPTKGRPQQLKRVINSIIKTAAKPNKVELVLRVDEDDETTLGALPGVKGMHKHTIIVKKPHTIYLSDLWDECYEFCTADRVMMCADDVIFRTKNWDNTIATRMPQPKTTFYFVWGNDKNQGADIATLPILSRCLIDAMGYFVPRGYIRDYCDTHLQDIMRRLEKLGTNAMFYLKNIIFEHMHPTVNKAKWDETYKYRMRLGSAGGHYSALCDHRQKMAQKLYDMVKNGDVDVPKR